MKTPGRFLNALGAGLLWGVVGALAGGGLYAFFWMLMPPVRLFQDDPFLNVPLFDAVLLIATPVIMFLVAGGIAFTHVFKEQSPLSPRPCA